MSGRIPRGLSEPMAGYPRPRPPRDYFFIAIAVFIVAGIVLVLFTAVRNGAFEDRREVRKYGNMTCIYNATDDVVESCEGSIG